MALSTTQSIWRSGGGDQTRTAYCGSGVMAAQFYVADASVTSAAKVKVSSASGAADLILPSGAVVLSVSIPAATDSTGHIDLGTIGYTSGTADTNSVASNLEIVAGTTSVGSVVVGDALTEMSYITAIKNSDGTGAISGYITYFVKDPIAGQQNV